MNANFFVFDSRSLASIRYSLNGKLAGPLAVEMLELFGRLRPAGCQDQLHECSFFGLSIRRFHRFPPIVFFLFFQSTSICVICGYKVQPLVFAKEGQNSRKFYSRIQ